MIEAIIVLSSIIGLWLLIVFSISIIILVCKRRIKRKKHAINVICAQKYDLLVSLCELMKENGIELPNSISETIVLSDHRNLQIINTEERMSLKALLTKTFIVLFDLAESKGLEQSNRYITIKNSVEDADDHYRKEVLLFNNEVKGYNYWIKSLLYRPIRWLFKLKDIETM